MRGVPERGELRNAINRADAYFAGDFAAMAASVQRVSGDSHYRQNRYGLVAWARHLDRWDDPAGGRAMSSSDRAWANSADEFLRMRGEKPLAITEGTS